VFEAKPGLDGKRKSVMTIYDAGAAPKLPPGDYVVVGEAGKARAEVAFTVKSGQRFDVPVILNAGIVAITAPNAKSLDVFEARVGLDGTRNRIASDYGDAFQIILPAGDYVALVEADKASAEAPFTVKAAERTELTIAMAAGMAAISSPGATQIEVFDAKVGLDGTRTRMFSSYDEIVEQLLPPGDYVPLPSRTVRAATSPWWWPLVSPRFPPLTHGRSRSIRQSWGWMASGRAISPTNTARRWKSPCRRAIMSPRPNTKTSRPPKPPSPCPTSSGWRLRLPSPDRGGTGAGGTA